MKRVILARTDERGVKYWAAMGLTPAEMADLDPEHWIDKFTYSEQPAVELALKLGLAIVPYNPVNEHPERIIHYPRSKRMPETWMALNMPPAVLESLPYPTWKQPDPEISSTSRVTHNRRAAQDLALERNLQITEVTDGAQ